MECLEVDLGGSVVKKHILGVKFVSSRILSESKVESKNRKFWWWFNPIGQLDRFFPFFYDFPKGSQPAPKAQFFKTLLKWLLPPSPRFECVKMLNLP